MVYVEEDWVDEEAVGHRGLDEQIAADTASNHGDGRCGGCEAGFGDTIVGAVNLDLFWLARHLLQQTEG